jgi:hypothetical protein
MDGSLAALIEQPVGAVNRAAETIPSPAVASATGVIGRSHESEYCRSCSNGDAGRLEQPLVPSHPLRGFTASRLTERSHDYAAAIHPSQS